MILRTLTVVWTLSAGAFLLMTAPGHAVQERFCPDGYEALRAGEYERGAHALEACLENDRLHWRVRGELGRLLANAQTALGDYRAAAETFEQVFALVADNRGDLDNPVLRRNRAALLYRTQDFDGALRDLDISIADQSDSAYARRLRGFVLLSLNRPGDATADFEASLEIDPNSANAALGLCQARLGAGLAAQALQACRNAARLSPDNPASLHQLGKALEAMDHMDEAAEAYADAHALAPDDPDIQADFERTRPN